MAMTRCPGGNDDKKAWRQWQQEELVATTTRRADGDNKEDEDITDEVGNKAMPPRSTSKMAPSGNMRISVAPRASTARTLRMSTLAMRSRNGKWATRRSTS